MVYIVDVVVLDCHIFEGLFAGSEGVDLRLEGFYAFLVLGSFFWVELLKALRVWYVIFALLIKGRELQLYLLEFQLFPHLGTIDHLQCQIEFFVQFFYDLVFNDPVGPSQAPLLSFSGPKGQHMIVLLYVRLPEQTQQRKAQLFSSIFPIIVNYVPKQLHVFHLKEFLALSLEVAHEPALISREGHVLPRLCLQLNDDTSEKVFGEDLLAFVKEAFLVAFEEDMIDLCKFIVIGVWQIQVRRQSDIIWCQFCKFLDLANPLNRVNLGHKDILLLRRTGNLLFLCVDNNDQTFLSGVHLFEGLLTLDELERLRPVQLVPVTHY